MRQHFYFLVCNCGPASSAGGWVPKEPGQAPGGRDRIRSPAALALHSLR